MEDKNAIPEMKHTQKQHIPYLGIYFESAAAK